MKRKLLILLLVCTALMVNLNGFGQKGVSGKVPSHIPDDLFWQCGNDADAYLDNATLRLVGGTTWSYFNGQEFRPPSNILIHLNPLPWQHLVNQIDSIHVNAQVITEGFISGSDSRYNRVSYVEIGPNVTSMGRYNIAEMPSLTKVVIREGITRLEADNCWSNPKLWQIVIPSSITWTDQCFLSDCPMLRHVVILSDHLFDYRKNTVDGWPLKVNDNITVWVPRDASSAFKIALTGQDHNWPPTKGMHTVMGMALMNEFRGSLKGEYPNQYFNMGLGEGNYFNTYPLFEYLYDSRLIRVNVYDIKTSYTATVNSIVDTPFVTPFKVLTWENLNYERLFKHDGNGNLSVYVQARSMRLNPFFIPNNLNFDSSENYYTLNAEFDPLESNTITKWEIEGFNTIGSVKNDRLKLDPKVDTFGIFPIKATSWEGLTAETTIHLLSTNETITDIKVKHLGEDKDVSLDLNATNFHAQVHVPEDTEEVTVNPVLRHNVNTLRVSYLDTQGQWQLAENGVVKLDPSQHSVPVEIRVQSEHRLHQNIDDELGKIYDLEVIPEVSRDARAGSLNAILIDKDGNEYPSQLVPEFHPDVYEYEVVSDLVAYYEPDALRYNIQEVRLEGSRYHPRAYNPDNIQFALDEGENEAVLRVNAQHHDYHSDYVVKIHRAGLPPPRLSRLTVEDTDVPLLPGQYKYELQVPAHQARVRVQAEAVEADHHIGGDGVYKPCLWNATNPNYRNGNKEYETDIPVEYYS